MTKISPRPLVLIGPSGAGKSTVVEHLARRPLVRIIPTVTTRPMRPFENTISHTFINQQTFNTMQQNGDFLGTTHIFGSDYGLPKLPVTDDQLIVLLRAPFVKQFQTHYPDCLIVQLEAPVPVLRQRLTQRGDQDRIDPAALEKETALGQTMADIIISTDQPIDACVNAITMRLPQA